MEHRRPTMIRRAAALGVAVLMAAVLGGCSETTDGLLPPPELPKKIEVAVDYQYRAGSGASVGIIVPAACVAGVRLDETFYAIASEGLDGVPARELVPADPLDGVVVPGCNDTGEIIEGDRPVQAWTIEGVDPDRAILVEYP